MGVGPAIFESAGKRTEHFVPGSYSRSNNVTSPSGVSAGNLCIIGTASSGKPKNVYEFATIGDAQTVLGSGELLEGVAFAFSGSNEYVPQKVMAIRVNKGTQGKATLKSGDVDVLTLTAWDYSAQTNQLKIKVEDGSIEKSKKVTVVFKDSVIEHDNIIKPSLQVIGTCEQPTVTINNDSMILSGTDEEGVAITEIIKFDDFPTITDIVTKINDTDYFTAISQDTDEKSLSKELDTVSSIDISEPVILYSNFKVFKEVLSSIEYIATVEDNGQTRTVPDNSSFVYFTGGSSTPATIEDWSDALAELEAHDIQIIATPSTDEDVQVLIANHCSIMASTLNRKERTCWLGGPINQTDEEALTKAREFNNKLVSYVTDTVIVANPITGATQTAPGAKLACMLAGIESSISINMPLTNKTLKVLGFAKTRQLPNMEKLIKGGVVVCNPSPDDVSNFVVIRSLTTYQSEDLISNERSMTREDLYMNRDLRKRFARPVGSPNVLSTASILATLNDAAKDWASAGLIIPSDSNENVWNKSVKIDGDKIYITFARYLTAPLNFAFITATNHVYKSTVEV